MSDAKTLEYFDNEAYAIQLEGRIAELEGRIELLTAANEAILSESTQEIERLNYLYKLDMDRAAKRIAELEHMLNHALRREETLRAIVGPLRRCGRIALSDTDLVTPERLDAFFDLSEALREDEGDE